MRGDDLIAGTVFERAGEAAYVMDPASERILAANDAGCRLLGYPREELLGTPIARIHPAEAVELARLLDRVVREGRASTVRLTCRTRGGSFIPTEISLHALRHGGRMLILGLVQDRSEDRRPAS